MLPDCRWLEPRASALEELSFTVRCPTDLGPVGLHKLLPFRLSATGAAADSLELDGSPPAGALAGPPHLRRLVLEWPGSFAWHPALALPALTRLCFPQGTRVVVDGRMNFAACCPLLEFEAQDGSLMGLPLPDPPADGSAWVPPPWLPPSVTSLCLCNANLRGLAGALHLLPNLRRHARGGGPAARDRMTGHGACSVAPAGVLQLRPML